MDWGNILSQSITQGLGVLAVIYALAAIGLNVQFGYTGLLNFGQAGFLAVAAYGLAVTIVMFELPLWVGVLVGIVAAVLLALLLGIPTLRLRACRRCQRPPALRSKPTWRPSTHSARAWPWSTRTRASPTCTCRAT